MRPIIGFEEYRDRIRGALEYLESDLERPFHLDFLARRTCMAPFHFHSVFRRTVGCAPVEYLRCRRLSQAARELLGSQTSVDRIGLRWGYGSPEAFSRAFRKHFHVWPGEYRRHGRPLFLHDSELSIPVWLTGRPGPVEIERVDSPRRVFAGLYLSGENHHATNMRLLYRFLDGMSESDQTNWVNADRVVPKWGRDVYEFFVGREVDGEWAVGAGLNALVIDPRVEVAIHLQASVDDLHGTDFARKMDQAVADHGFHSRLDEWKLERRWGPDRWMRRVYRIEFPVTPIGID